MVSVHLFPPIQTFEYGYKDLFRKDLTRHKVGGLTKDIVGTLICLIWHFSFCQGLFTLLSPLILPHHYFSPCINGHIYEVTQHSLLGPEYDGNSRGSQLHFPPFDFENWVSISHSRLEARDSQTESTRMKGRSSRSHIDAWDQNKEILVPVSKF